MISVDFQRYSEIPQKKIFICKTWNRALEFDKNVRIQCAKNSTKILQK